MFVNNHLNPPDRGRGGRVITVVTLILADASQFVTQFYQRLLTVETRQKISTAPHGAALTCRSGAWSDWCVNVERSGLLNIRFFFICKFSMEVKVCFVDV